MSNFDIESLPVTIAYAGEVNRDGWQCDHWNVTINKTWHTEYFTGLGHRTKPKQQWATTRPVKPKIADIMYSLFLDAEAGDYNFSDWCDMFGYSDDSLKALDIYRACTVTAKNIRKHFTVAEREAIQSIIQDM